MRNTLTAIVVTVAVILVLGWLLTHTGSSLNSRGRLFHSVAGVSTAEDGRSTVLRFACAAGIRSPAQEIVDAYEQEYDVRIQVDYGGSGALLSKLEISRQGDVFLTAEQSQVETGREKGLLAEAIPVATLVPVIAVAKGNPKDIRSVHDFAREDLRVALCAPESAAAGKVTERLLEDSGVKDAVMQAVQERGVVKPTVNDVANDVKIGAMDAAIVWDVTVKEYPELAAVPIENCETYKQSVFITVLRDTPQPTSALRFARYLSAKDKGLAVFQQHGYAVAEGDAWEETPEVLYYSGGVNRPAIEPLLQAFERREGCRISTVFNGCGILVGQIKVADTPDVYHTCDISFMREVSERFAPPTHVSQTPMVIATLKGNPRNVRTLEDLGNDGVRIGLANEQQSALGALTARLLRDQGLYDRVQKNVVSNTPTADLLVNQLVTGGLDAVVVYEANIAHQRDKTEQYDIPLPGAVALQTFAVSLNSQHKQLMQRFLESLVSAEGREQYRQCGFREPAS